MTNIAMIGVGLMGHGIAKNLLRSGFTVRFFDHHGNQNCDDLLALGATAHTDYTSLCQDCAVYLLCVTGTPEVQQIIEHDLQPCLCAGDMIIDCSTGIPEETLLLAERLARAGIRYIDAPMTRTPNEAETGQLNLLVGCRRETLQEIQPILQCFAENIIHAGEVGSGQTLKLLHNFVSLGFSAILCEAASIAEQSAITPETLLEVLETGGGRGAILERLRPMIQNADDQGFIFSLKNCAKDMHYYQKLSHNKLAFGSLAPALFALFQQAAATEPNTTIPQLIPLQQGQ